MTSPVCPGTRWKRTFLKQSHKTPRSELSPKTLGMLVRDQDVGWESLLTKPSTVSNNLAVTKVALEMNFMLSF